MSFTSTDPVEQFLIEVHGLRDRDGRLAAYRLGEDTEDEIRIARILVAKISAMEREACAKLCDEMWTGRGDLGAICSSAIRARGNS